MASVPVPSTRHQISIGRLHAGQRQAVAAMRGRRFMALRCGRRFGKTELAKNWILRGALLGETCAWLVPQHVTATEVSVEVQQRLSILLEPGSRSGVVMRLKTGGRIDFWSLENPIAGRGRGYHRIVIDEAAFTKPGGNREVGSMQNIWETALKPTLYDNAGRALVCSNAAGKDPDNFFYAICTDPAFGFHEFHATTLDNPELPKRLAHESHEAWLARRQALQDELKRDNDPLVYAQEYLAEFVDWSGVAFFSREKLLRDGQAVPWPTRCDSVFAVIDTASKTGTEHDATAVTYFAYDSLASGARLFILDWDIAQIEGSLLEVWLPAVFQRLEQLARECRATYGHVGAHIEDRNSGTILLQQAQRRGLRAGAIQSRLTAMGKDERALSVSGYVHRGLVKYTDHAFHKVQVYKNISRNHLVDQVESFRLGDRRSHREDDLLDSFCYGIALAFGDENGF